MGTFADNSKRLEFNLREIEYSMGTLSETVSFDTPAPLHYFYFEDKLTQNSLTL